MGDTFIEKLAGLLFFKVLQHIPQNNHVIAAEGVDDVESVSDKYVIVDFPLMTLDIIRKYLNAVYFYFPVFFAIPLTDHDIEEISGDEPQFPIAQPDIQDR